MLTLLIASVLSGFPQGQLQGQPAKERLPEGKQHGIQCQASGEYVGNAINPVFSLTISGPKEKVWEYRYVDAGFGFKAAEEMAVKGTYELDGQLAIFTGQVKHAKKEEAEFRAAMNFDHSDQKVEFNRFFKGADGTFHYARLVSKGKGRLDSQRRVSVDSDG